MTTVRSMVLALSCLFSTVGVGQEPIKVLIAVDMEGVTGVVTAEQLGPAGFEYQRFREFMTDEALAAVAGAREAGATEILVVDSHGNGQNLLIDRFPPEVRIIRSWPRPLGMVAGLDSSFAAVVFIGYHSGTTNRHGVRAHTMSSANITSLKVNGEEVSESGWGAMIAGTFGVPVVAISGDEAAVGELLVRIPGAEGAIVKQSISFHSANTMTPAAGQALIRERVREGVRKRGSISPVSPPSTEPVTVDITFKNYRPAEVLAYLPMFERPTSHSIQFTVKDMLAASQVFEFVGDYEIGLSP